MSKISRWRVHKNYLLFIVLFYFFLLKDWLERGISFIGYGDEMFALLAVPFFFLEFKKNQYILKIKRGGYGKYVIIFLLAGLIANAVYMYQYFFTVALPDAFLCLKFWLALYVGKKLFAEMDLERYGEKIYGHVKIVTLLYLSLVVLDNVFKIFRADIRYGMRSTQLMYSHPTVFTACCVFLIMVLLFVREYAADYKKWLFILLFLMCTTLRSKAFGGAFAIALICYFIFYRKKRVRIRTLIVFLPLVAALGWEQIEFYFFNAMRSDFARYQLLATSLKILKDYFPIGTGFGTFGSHFSGINYSPVYRLYGLTNVHGLQEGRAYFISDSFWPMIMGQTGIIGTVSYVLAIIILFRAIQKIRNVNTSYYASALCGICYLLISSVAESAFVNPLAMPIAFMIGFLFGCKNISRETVKGRAEAGDLDANIEMRLEG